MPPAAGYFGDGGLVGGSWLHLSHQEAAASSPGRTSVCFFPSLDLLFCLFLLKLLRNPQSQPQNPD